MPIFMISMNLTSFVWLWHAAVQEITDKNDVGDSANQSGFFLSKATENGVRPLRVMCL